MTGPAREESDGLPTTIIIVFVVNHEERLIMERTRLMSDDKGTGVLENIPDPLTGLVQKGKESNRVHR